MSTSTPSLRPVSTWLAAIYALIAAMVVIGGITRLTGSGLSMVDWHPLMGALPPLDEAAWQAVFERYQQSPQFAQVNHWMTLGDFKQIFFWEYVHRLFGRLIGVAFFVPWLVFVLQKRLHGAVAWRAGVAFLLGGAQGLLGWFMVKSGLVDVPEVSHFRLAAHLSLAFFVAQWVQWLWMQLRFGPQARAGGVARWACWGLVGLIALQVVWGAFMAGTKAGKIYSTFPDMNGELVPRGWRTTESLGWDLTSNPVGIHFAHRSLAWIVLAATLTMAWTVIRNARAAGNDLQRRVGWLLASVAGLQVALGAATVLTSVQISWAVAHQGVALLLLSLATATAYVCGGPAGATGGQAPAPAGPTGQ